MPDDRAKSSHKLDIALRSTLRKLPRGGKPLLSIRARLIVLALLAVAPLMFERIHAIEEARGAHIARAHAQVIELAQRGAEAQHEIILSVQALVQIVARVYARTPLDPSDCNRYLSSLADNIPWIRGLSVAGPDGRVRCSTRTQAIGLNFGDRSHFRKALQSRAFTLSDYLIGRLSGPPTIIATLPAVQEDGTIDGVVLAAINLEWIGELAAAATERSGASVLLVDGNGTLTAASANLAGDIGKRFADSALVRDMLAHDEGTLTTAGLDGVQRIFAYVRVPWTNARLAVGLDQAAVQAGINREIGIGYLQLALIGALVLLVVWFGGEQLIVRPIRSLVRTVARFGRGDLHVRAHEERWVAEFEPLAAAFDDMADKLATREEELRIANQHLEELASLDGLTGLANRRGFDRELQHAWEHAAERRAPLALMMIDIDHFKLYNDRYGHVAGDTCLRAVGETLSLVTLEEAVLVARYGGEEFALLLPGLDLTRAAALAEEARKAIEDLMINHAQSPSGLVTISIGVEALVPERGRPAAELVEAADTALYAAKRGGRNTVVAHAPLVFSMAS
jgi:diguanylate cyclase (GGDEF)-like protein